MFFWYKLMLIMPGMACVWGDMDLRKLFGNNINNEEAWSQLMKLKNCPKPNPMTGSIIMVDESIAAGAKFLDNPNVTSRFECEFECCYKRKAGCNIAVYAAEQKHCYLFSCGQPSKCKFDQRAGYTVSLISDEDTTTLKPSTKTPESTAPTTASPPKELHLLDGCRPEIDTCVTANTECSNKGFCMCKQGFHPKNGVCRKDCIKGLEYECTNGDPKYAQPDCIAEYDVCDGTPQCSDGSDEKDCKKKGDFDWSNINNVGELNDKIKEYMKDHPEMKDEILKSETTTSKSSPTFVDIKNLVGDNKSTDEQKKKDDQETELAKLQQVSTEKSAPSAAPTQPSAKTEKVELAEGANKTGSVLNDEAVVKEKETPDDTSTQSAVIALSLSLSLTVVLVAYLGCRYKNMRSRIGRGGKAYRQFRGTDVDYLIDGMYL